MEPQKLKRVIIKEELVALTGNYVDAILLNQLLYWSERVKDFDLFMQQEAETESREPENQLFGWIYKSFKELSDETMLGLVPNSIKTHLNNLCEKGFIFVRENRNNWDRRKEYKINLKYIQKELILLGYSLDGYSIGLPFAENANGCAENANGFANSANRTVKNCKTVTEITTETTTEKKNERKKSYEKILSGISEQALKDTYYDFIKMRTLIKSPMTDRALKMLIDKVNSMSNSTEIKIKILNQSILNNWKSVYPLKDNIAIKKYSDSDLDETEVMLAQRREERRKLNEQ